MKLNLSSIMINLVSMILLGARTAIALPSNLPAPVDGVPVCNPSSGTDCDPNVDMPCCMNVNTYATCENDEAAGGSGYVWQFVYCHNLENNEKVCAQSGSNAWCVVDTQIPVG